MDNNNNKVNYINKSLKRSLVVLLVSNLIVQVTGGSGFYCPDLKPPTGDGTTSINGISDNTLREDALRWLLGCNRSDGRGLTYKQIKEYYDKTRSAVLSDPNDTPRYAPFCVTSKNTEADLSHFLPILERLETHKPKSVKDSFVPIWNDPKKPANFGLADFTMTRVNTRDAKIPYLRQWAHLQFKFAFGHKGILIMPISGPVGLPFGQLNFDFICKDTDLAHWKVIQRTKVIPCRRQPGSALKMPNVLAVGGHPDAEHYPFSKLDVHFTWQDSHCNEAIAFQFLILLVSTFPDNYHLFRTPWYVHKEPDSRDGVSYPVNPDWRLDRSMTCMGGPPGACSDRDNCLMYQLNPDYELEIPYNREYDDCIMGKTPSDSISRTCPPGPFRCSGAPKTYDAWIEQRQGLLALNKGCKKCSIPEDKPLFHNRLTSAAEIKESLGGVPAPFKPHYELVVGVKIIDTVQARFETEAEKYFRSSKKFHGWTMTFSWFFLLPIIIFISRFFKEVGILDMNSCSVFFGLPAWFWSRVILSYIGLTINWLSFVRIAPYSFERRIDCNRVEDGDRNVCTRFQTFHVHVIIGLFLNIFYTVQFVLGWIRPVRPHWRNVFIWIHSLGGYISWILACLIAMTNTACMEIKVEVIVMWIFSILAFGIASLCQYLQDLKLELNPPRHLFPVLEGIEGHANPPYRSSKFVLFMGWIILNLVMFMLVQASYKRMEETLIPQEAVVYNYSGLFSDSCTVMGAEYILNILACKGNPLMAHCVKLNTSLV